MAEEILLGLCDFLQPYLPLVNSHNVDYLTHDHWHHYLPEWMRQNEPIDLYLFYEQRYQQQTSPVVNHELEAFLDQLVYWRKRIEQVTWTREQFDQQILGQREKSVPKGYKYANRTFMSEKKEHEVDILAPLIDQVARLSSTESIIDYGSGRGYLGVQMAHDYDRDVLGIELSAATVHSGERRQALLLKHQKEFSQNRHYRTTSTLVTSETNFEALFYDTFHLSSASFLLCGLHACGSLSSSLLYHFVEKPSVRAVVNVACCYHLLEEKFVPNPFTPIPIRVDQCFESDPCSFPLSRSLIERKMHLGRNARMLAVQSFERNKVDQTSNAGLWYRALMQVILTEVYQIQTKVEEIKLGKLTKKCPTFETYVWKALDKLQLDKSKMTTSLIEEYWRRYESQQFQLHTFIQFKVLFSGLIEMLILLDRLVFLQQSSPSAHSYLIALFDPILSPRRWCLVSMKA